MSERKAYAKIVGEHGVAYMLEPTMVIGRGPASVDLVLSGDPSISRRHVQIDFSPDLQEFEIKVIGKNGIFVNGQFLRNSDRPLGLRSHTDIIIGRDNPRLLTFYLPSSTRKEKKVPASNGNNGPDSILSLVGQLLIAANRPLNANEIYYRLIAMKVRLVETIGSTQAIESSIRAVLCGNRHIFVTYAADDLDAMAEQLGETNGKKNMLAGFAVHPEHRLRFLKQHARTTGNALASGNDVVMTEANGHA